MLPPSDDVLCQLGPVPGSLIPPSFPACPILCADYLEQAAIISPPSYPTKETRDICVPRFRSAGISSIPYKLQMRERKGENAAQSDQCIRVENHLEISCDSLHS